MTTAPAVDEREHVAAFKSAINGALVASGSSARCYSYDEVPGSSQSADGSVAPGKLPSIFVLVSVERAVVLPRRLCGRAGRSSWRVAFRSVGRTVAESQWARLRLVEAVDEMRFEVDGYLSGPVTHESSDAPQWSDKRYAATSTFTYEI